MLSIYRTILKLCCVAVTLALIQFMRRCVNGDKRGDAILIALFGRIMQHRIGGSGWDGSFGRRLDAPKHQFCDATHGMGAPWRYVRTLDAGTGTAEEQHGTCSLLIKL